MTYSEIANRYDNFYAPAYQVILEGEDLVKTHNVEITQVNFEDMLEGADRFSFTVNDPSMKWINNNLFSPG